MVTAASPICEGVRLCRCPLCGDTCMAVELIRGATPATRSFHVMAKPTGAICNLDCVYCYYLKKEDLYPETKSFRMERDVLEDYIAQHIEGSPCLLYTSPSPRD